MQLRRYAWLGIIIVLVLVVIVVVLYLRTSTNHSRVGAKEIVWGEYRGLDYWLRRCEQAIVFIEIDGVKYFNVTGRPPYCVYVPEAKRIVFSTYVLGNHEDPTIYLYDTISERMDRVHTNGMFGQLIANIPMKLLPGELPFEERIGRATDREIEIISINGNIEERFTIDLHSLEVRRSAK